jgi:hypothetical protein
MEKYTLDKYDFKKFLLDELSDARQEELIFWKNGIPLPVDLVYSIFERRGKLFKSYLDHISAVYLYSFILKKQGENWGTRIEKLPSSEISIDKSDIVANFTFYMESSGVYEMAKELAEALMLHDYLPEPVRLFDSLCHEGRKYKRLYIPKSFKDIITAYSDSLLTVIGVSNGDMFGNVVADELGIYRSGFSDAFAVIFNKLVDFILNNYNGQASSTVHSRVKLTQLNSEVGETNELEYDVIRDGSIWEPRYNNAKVSFVLNSNHPYCDYIKRGNINAEMVLAEFAEVLSQIEYESIKDSERRILEITRQELSRKLRLKLESLRSITQ